MKKVSPRTSFGPIVWRLIWSHHRPSLVMLAEPEWFEDFFNDPLEIITEAEDEEEENENTLSLAIKVSKTDAEDDRDDPPSS